MGFANDALRYAELGYRVFPLVPHDKTPLTEHGCRDATTDEERIGEWWSTWPEANIGISTDGLVVIDVDPLSDGSRNDWADDIDRLTDLVRNAASDTPRGGSHFWFRQPVGGDIRNSAGRIAPGVDVRGNGGYVVAPPSVSVHGAYRWREGYELECGPERLTEPPAWFLGLLAQRKAAPWLVAPGEGEIPAGMRNETLASIGGHLRRCGMSEGIVAAALQRANVERCKPPLDSEEVAKIAWSVGRYEPDQVAVALAEGWAAQDAAAPFVENPGPLPDHLLMPPGFIGDVVRWNLDTAYKLQPELALGGALSLFGALCGRKVEDERGTRGNIYCMGVADSGAGKEHARRINKSVLEAIGADDMLGPESIGSSQGMLAALAAQPALLFQLDEFGRFLETTRDAKRAPHLFNVVTVMLKLYSSADTTYVGDALADRKKVVRIRQPHACVYATTTPKHLLDALSPEAFEDGFAGRFLCFFAADHDPEPTGRGGLGIVPKPVSIAADFLYGYRPGGNLASENPQPRRLSFSDAAREVYAAFETEARARRRRPASGSVLWTRAVEKAAKLALLHAVSGNAATADSIDETSARWGVDLTRHLTMQMEWHARRHVGETPFERDLLAVLREIEDAGDAGLTTVELSKRTRRFKSRDRLELLNTLLVCGLILEERVQTSGRPMVRYRKAD